MRKGTFIASLVAFGALAFAAVATSATVTTTVVRIDETEAFYGGNCGFPLTATFVGDIRQKTIEKNDGSVQLIFTPVGPVRLTVTNPANGRSLSSIQAGGEIVQIRDGSFVDHRGGITWNFHIPGMGGVLQWIGRDDFVTGGFHGNFTSDTSAFCNYLAGV